MRPATVGLWMLTGAMMAALHAAAIAVTIRRASDAPEKVRRLLTRTLPLRLALQALVIYGAISYGISGVAGWLSGYLIGRSLLVTWALKRTEALGSALKRG